MASFASERQKIKFAELVKAGKVSKAEYEKRLAETGTRKLPNHVKDLKVKK